MVARDRAASILPGTYGDSGVKLLTDIVTMIGGPDLLTIWLIRDGLALIVLRYTLPAAALRG